MKNTIVFKLYKSRELISSSLFLKISYYHSQLLQFLSIDDCLFSYLFDVKYLALLSFKCFANKNLLMQRHDILSTFYYNVRFLTFEKYPLSTCLVQQVVDRFTVLINVILCPISSCTCNKPCGFQHLAFSQPCLCLSLCTQNPVSNVLHHNRLVV